MALSGKAFLAIWHDIVPESWDEYMEWHTREHMPERLAIPGFRVGKRLVNHALDVHRIGTVYAGDDLEVFRSPAYLERLNNPTDWSLEVQPAFRNFLRVACDRLASRGVGEGGVMATVRLDFTGPDGAAQLRAGADQLADDLLSITGVCCSHIGLARPEFSDVRTRETELRPEMNEQGFDAVVLVEGNGRPELEAVADRISATITAAGSGVTNPVLQVYDLSYQLRNSDLQPEGGAQ